MTPGSARFTAMPRSGALLLLLCDVVAGCGATVENPVAEPDAAVDAMAEQWPDPGCSRPLARPPGPDPAASARSSGKDVVFAISAVRLGRLGADGNDSGIEWQKLGYDIDCSDGSPSDWPLLCSTPTAGATASHINGELGRDNAVSRRLLGNFIGYDPQFELWHNTAIKTGAWGLLIQVSVEDGVENAEHVPGATFAAAPTDTPPTWTGVETRSPDAAGFDLSGHPVSTADGYVSGGTWVSQRTLAIEIPIDHANPYPALQIRHALLTLELGAGADGNVAGVISGMVDPSELNNSFLERAAHGNPAKCQMQGSVDLKSYADVLPNGAQDSTLPCAYMSYGMAFTARRVVLGAPVSVPPRPAPICN